MQTSKMTTRTLQILALLAFALPASTASGYSFFDGYPDGYQSYEAYVAGKTSEATSVRATSAGSIAIATQSGRTAATDFEPRIRTSLATPGTGLYSAKYRGLVILVQ